MPLSPQIPLPPDVLSAGLQLFKTEEALRDCPGVRSDARAVVRFNGTRARTQKARSQTDQPARSARDGHRRCIAPYYGLTRSAARPARAGKVDGLPRHDEITGKETSPREPAIAPLTSNRVCGPSPTRHCRIVRASDRTRAGTIY